MATKTYSQLQSEIEALKSHAESVRQAELSEVIGKIQDAIKTYGITAQDLFGGKGSRGGKAMKAKPTGAKFSDGQGNVWVGRGPRPQWLRDALASGRSLSDFETGKAPSTPFAAKKVAKKAAAKKTKPGFAKYHGAEGQSWSGRGPQPRWFKEAIAGGKTPADLSA